MVFQEGNSVPEPAFLSYNITRFNFNKTVLEQIVILRIHSIAKPLTLKKHKP